MLAEKYTRRQLLPPKELRRTFLHEPSYTCTTPSRPICFTDDLFALYLQVVAADVAVGGDGGGGEHVQGESEGPDRHGELALQEEVEGPRARRQHQRHRQRRVCGFCGVMGGKRHNVRKLVNKVRSVGKEDERVGRLHYVRELVNGR